MIGWVIYVTGGIMLEGFYWTPAEIAFLAPTGAIIVGVMTVWMQGRIAKKNISAQKANLDEQRAHSLTDQRRLAYQALVAAILEQPGHPGPPVTLNKSEEWANRMEGWVGTLRAAQAAVITIAGDDVFESLNMATTEIQHEVWEIQRSVSAGRTIIDKYRPDLGGSGQMDQHDTELVESHAHKVDVRLVKIGFITDDLVDMIRKNLTEYASSE